MARLQLPLNRWPLCAPCLALGAGPSSNPPDGSPTSMPRCSLHAGPAICRKAIARPSRAGQISTAIPTFYFCMPALLLLVEDNELNRDKLSRRLERRVRAPNGCGWRSRGEHGHGVATAPHLDGCEPSGDGRLGSHTPTEGRSGDSHHPHHCTHLLY